MKIFYKLLPCLLLVCFSLIAWHPNTSKTGITKFYYYKNSPFYLNLKPDAVFIKLNKELPQSMFNELISEFSGATLNSARYIPGDKRYFVNLNSSLSESALIELSNRLSINPDVQYVSPVFSPDNGKTLIGSEDQIMVQFKPNVTTSTINSFLANRNLTVIQELALTGGLSYVLQVPQNEFAIDAANEMHLSGMVNWAEPNLFFTNVLCFDPNDPFYPMEWAKKNLGNNIPGGITGTIDCDMDVDSAWNFTLGLSQCRIAISDTGVDTVHEDLAANMVVGSGFDFFNNDPWAFDDMGHGTCCAGIVAAVGNNNIGHSGVAPNCKLIPVKWLSASGGGNLTGATNATIWSYQKGAWIISNSWGFIGGSSSALDQAITDAATLGRGGKGSLFVVASGNENGAMRYPANTHPRVLAVGGISPCNQRKSPSSCDLENFWGASFGTNLDLVAPCVKIYATDITGPGGFTGTNYDPTFNGTSSATPNTAGVCALALSMDSTMIWDTLRVRVDRTCEKRGTYTYDQPGPRGIGQWNNEMGYGLVNARLLLASLNPPPPPSVEDSSICRTGLNKAITDFTLTQDTISITVGANCNVIDINLRIDTIVHTFVSDLVVRLRKGSVSAVLVNQRGGGGDNFINTRFNDSASNPISSGTAPFNGEFRPETPLTAFNSQPVNGNWIISVRDTASGDSGMLKSWCLTVKYDCLSGQGGEITTIIPADYQLLQNYPNPFNPNTKIRFGLPKLSAVKLVVYDVLGRVVRVLYDGLKSAGQHEIDFDGTNLASGIYYYKLEAGDFSDVKKMVIVK